MSMEEAPTQESLHFSAIGASRLDLHILNLFKIHVKRGRLRNESTDEEAPTELDTANRPAGFLEVTKELNTSIVSCISRILPPHFGVIQANRPAPEKQFVYYFEMCVIDPGEMGEMAIGFTEKGFKMCRPPWRRRREEVYYQNDGRLYCGPRPNYMYGPHSFSQWDFVGAGINYGRNEVFFTLNGCVADSHINLLKGPKFPTIALTSLNEQVVVNFDRSTTALIVEEYEAEMKEKVADPIPENLLVDIFLADEPPSPSTAHRLVHSYFLHSGYKETLQAFALDHEDAAPHVEMSTDGEVTHFDLGYRLNERNTVMQFIRDGNITDSLGLLQPSYIQHEYSAALFLLHCLKFIELVREGKRSDALEYGSEKLNKFYKLSDYRFLIEECCALFVSTSPLESSVGYLLDVEWRYLVAEAVNVAILDTNPNQRDPRDRSFHTYIETLLLHLQFCCNEGKGMGITPLVFLDCLSNIHNDAHIL